jgi:hypothetical protein
MVKFYQDYGASLNTFHKNWNISQHHCDICGWDGITCSGTDIVTLSFEYKIEKKFSFFLYKMTLNKTKFSIVFFLKSVLLKMIRSQKIGP